MQKWEYHTVTVKRDFALFGLQPWEGDLDLVQLGEQGWELVSVVPHSDEVGHNSGLTTSVLWVFKRPKS